MDEKDLAEIEARVEAATPGPWYPIVTDDEFYQGAVYVGLDVRGRQGEHLFVDDGRGQKLLATGGIDSGRVVAVIRIPLNSVTPVKASGVPPYRRIRTFSYSRWSD